MYRHILIATDGSELAARGIEQGLALAGPLGAKVTVLSVSQPLDTAAARAAAIGGIADPIGRYDQQIDEEMKNRFRSIEERAAEHGVEVDLLHEIDDHPAEAIVRTAKLKSCDLIVMSSHGRRGAARLILGSPTSEVLAHTTLPGLVVR
jgi:nucleotide-binding universal stress UspA family protein